jgi:hypothetical protein
VLAAVLALAAAPPARAEPLDLDLGRLGAPDPKVWGTLVAGSTPVEQATYARDARQRFAMVSTQLALALSSAILQPASTTGHSGFDVGFEVATLGADSGGHGTAPSGFSNQIWPTRSTQPGLLYLPSFHVRKALPWSFEVGGRVIHLAQSSYFAAQGEAKWAINEGFEYLPDVAVRAAYTRMFGEEDLNLGTLDLDLLVSKRWSLGGVASLTPYVAARYTRISASSEQIAFADGVAAAFPHFSAGLYRTTLGLRFNAYVTSLAMEATYFGGASPSDSDYEGVKLASAFGGAAKLGWEF